MTLKHWTTALFVFTASLALLVGCQSTTEMPFEVLATDPNSDRNCTINQFEAREEGLHARGGTGGMALNYPGSRATPVALPSFVSGQLNAIDDFAITEDVAILILDDFGGGFYNGIPVKSNYRLGKALFDYRHKGNTAKEITANLRVFLEQQMKTNRLPHGALVYNHTLAVLERMTGVSVSSISPNGSQVTFMLNGKKIVVKAIETNNFDTLTIRNNLESTIEALTAQNIRNIAVNMSFSIVPCEIILGYKTSKFDSLEDYLLALEEDGGEGFASLEDAFDDIATMLVGDPLRNFIDTTSPTSLAAFNIIYVASAGNYSLNFSLAPAVWPNVISVASSNASTRFQQSSFSNDGEIMTPGAWFTLTDPLNRNGVGKNAAEMVYAGTSFSDVKVTLFSALDIGKAGTDQECAALGGITPDLAYPYPVFANKSLASAIAERCP